jgi:hypothetical protein
MGGVLSSTRILNRYGGVLGNRFVGCVGVPEEKRMWGPPLRMALTHASGWLQGRVYSLSENHSAVSIIVSSASA